MLQLCTMIDCRVNYTLRVLCIVEFQNAIGKSRLRVHSDRLLGPLVQRVCTQARAIEGGFSVAQGGRSEPFVFWLTDKPGRCEPAEPTVSDLIADPPRPSRVYAGSLGDAEHVALIQGLAEWERRAAVPCRWQSRLRLRSKSPGESSYQQQGCTQPWGSMTTSAQWG